MAVGLRWFGDGALTETPSQPPAAAPSAESATIGAGFIPAPIVAFPQRYDACAVAGAASSASCSSATERVVTSTGHGAR